MRSRGLSLWLFFLIVCGSRFAPAAAPEEQYRKAMSLLPAGDNARNDALSLLRLAADQGYFPARTALGTVYEQGIGVMRDPQKAIDWYKKAADQGDWVAQFSLGRIYFAGDGVIRDTAEAKKWLEKAALDPRDSGASFYLGLLHDEGQGTATDDPQARKWYRQSAARGNPFAMEWLAVLLLKGDQKDKEEALVLLLVAAEMGNHHVDSLLLSTQRDLGRTAADAARLRALDLRESVQAYTRQTCDGWPEQYSGAPAPPPINFQMQCVQ